jgi:hexosaminidase
LNIHLVFDYTTNEGYKLTISKTIDKVSALIKASNFYGARNALETLSQLIIYEEIKNEIVMVVDGEVEDEPRFKHRGISLDTSRNFFPVDVIKRTINGMAMVKLNTFHWHISDSQNFPLLLKSHPDLATGSAYSLDKVYTPEDVIEIVKYAKSRGIRVIPEIDVPGHTSEGWFRKNLTSCYHPEPSQPCMGAHPCGQLDPSKGELYIVLEDIYRELVEYFDNPEIFHTGGDEIFLPCWNASSSLQSWMLNRGWNLNEEGFMSLWGYFQENAVNAFDKVRSKKVQIIVWSSTMTLEPFVSQYLDKDRYIIQMWTKGDSDEVKTLLENGYRLIMSNYDALYFDCGFGSWVRDGNNWCSPYIGWQKVYDNRMEDIGGEHVDLIVGAEATLFAEQVDEYSLDARLWPRASALAERLWTSI